MAYMKRTAALLLAFCLLLSAPSAWALEITEERFPGYYFELRTEQQTVRDALMQAKLYSGKASLDLVPANADDTALLSRSKISAERGEIRGIIIGFKMPQGKGIRNRQVIGSRYWLGFRRNEASDALEENLAWLEERFGASPVGRGQYLLMLGDDLVEVSVYQPGNSRMDIVFDMALAEDAEQALAAYGYQSPEDVPAAPWEPIGIPSAEE